ncbi:hypothetical protein [Haliscomenobacter sp.]|uniref:hypothetical protein n=1 Tax=Haliscomenobacter sp. TaxID=2717303 RepID=UPI003593312D
MNIYSFQEIKELIEKNELKEALNIMLACTDFINDFYNNDSQNNTLHANLLGKNLHNDLINLKGWLAGNNRNFRNGIISIGDFVLNENKIRIALINIVEELKSIDGLIQDLRFSIKKMMHELPNYKRSYESFVEIDYNKITNGELNIIKFDLAEIQGIGDFLNAVYLAMSDFLPPFTYEEKWILVDIEGQKMYYKSRLDKLENIDKENLSKYNIVKGTKLEVMPLLADK